MKRSTLVLLLLIGSPLLLTSQPQNQASTRSPHGNLSVPCEACHTSISWKPIRAVPDFDHNQTSYPLRGMHASLTSCTQCHTKLVFTDVGHACSDCHADIHRGQMGANCEACHSVKGWQVSIEDIKQHQNRFPLIGAHAAVTCDSCHTGAATGQFAGLSTDCISCHDADFQKASNPSHTALNFPTDCQQCHSMNSWIGAQFDHEKFTGFPLTGGHARLECSQCHVNNDFTTAATTCVGCHLTDFNKTTNPNHRSLGLSQDCASCHNTVSWLNATFDHNKTTFPLTGAHTSVQCSQCHTTSDFAAAPTQCVGCHMANFQQATNPNHVSGRFPQTCEQCHSTTSWLNATFDHNKTAFPLLGAHASVQCSQCHTTSDFAAAPTQCVGCHLANFQQATNPNHVSGGFPQTCEQCHNTTSWLNATFDHSKTAFPLTGAHTSVQCSQCHTTSDFSAAPTQCSGCHLSSFQSATNPPHVSGGFAQTCEQCHNTTSWLTSSFNHNTMTKFQLTGAHIALQCSQCHTSGAFSATPTTCVACHLTQFQQTTNPNHVSGGFPQACEQCHNTTNWQNATFDHSKTAFPLTGAHASVQCSQCHTTSNFAAAPTQCVGCHLANFQQTTNPNHVTSGIPQTCEQCHNTTSWQNATFDHSKTAFPLTGAHTSVQCSQCHTTSDFAAAPTQCVGCHLSSFQSTTNPPHVSGGFAQTCEQCHNTTSWLTSSFNHNTMTKFQLTGAHIALQCSQCHTSGAFSATPTTCVACHLTQFQQTTNPNHVSGGFPQTCEQCHNTTSWLNATFDHSKTAFPLTGAHTSVQCSQCHTTSNFAAAPTQCVGCHLSSFQSTTNPPHVSGGFAQTCEQCHNTTSWLTSSFNHNTMTKFQLTGAHIALQCSQCHTSGAFSATPTTCVACHLTQFQQTTNPNHVTGGFPQTCEQCHNTTSWLNATFDHSKTAFPLTGAHTSVQCSQCHTTSNFAAAPTQCAGCHLSSFQSTTNPPHVSGGFAQTCEQCHNTTSWLTSSFNHNTMTKFQLTGAHSTLQCSQCHTSGPFSATPTLCASCHMTDFQGTTNPNHVAAGFPTDCSVCHSTTNWLGATFDHSKTAFPLTGAHVSLGCNSCHGNGVFAGLPTTCVSCHLTQFQQTTSPNHVTSGFPQDCTLCHSTANWTSSTFDHSTTAFPLTGAHTSVACSSCHINGNFTTTPTDCYSCHQTQYTGTTNPNHVAAGFPTTCQTCHTTTAWTGATFNHTQFPIFSGTHNQNVWVTCSACHANSADYSTFTCIACHTHTQAATDPHHSGVRGYVYAATTCYSCHRNGNGG